MKPIEAFKRAMFYVSGLCSQRTPNQPGAIINRLPDETRDALKELKSDDIGVDAQLDDVKYFAGSDEYYQNKKFEKDRREFDKKLGIQSSRKKYDEHG